MILPLITIILPFLVQGTPVELDVRAGCNGDNCLRALRGNPTVASAFCSSYLTVTTTFTTTTTTSVPYGGLFPSVDKRNEVIPRITAAPHIGSPELVRRIADGPSAFSSICTEAATALSSGCSCLLGTGAPAAATTTTATATYTLPLPAECSASNNYGLSNIPLTFNFSAVFPDGDSGLGWATIPGACCAYCHASPNCYLYFEQIDFNPVPPGGGKRQANLVSCGVQLVGLSPIQPLGIASCPLGSVTLTPAAPQTHTLYGAGPCATVLSA